MLHDEPSRVKYTIKNSQIVQVKLMQNTGKSSVVICFVCVIDVLNDSKSFIESLRLKNYEILSSTTWGIL